jgi:chemotaxis protein CheX
MTEISNEHLRQEFLVEAVRHATKEVFATMLNLELREEPAYVDKKQTPTAHGIVSFVGFAGSWIGTGSIWCTPTFACEISARLLTSEQHDVDEVVLDAVAEVTNMIIGNAKTKLEEILGELALSIPTVIYGRNFMSKTVGSTAWTIVPFSYKDERMEVHICLAPGRTTPFPEKYALTGAVTTG